MDTLTARGRGIRSMGTKTVSKWGFNPSIQQLVEGFAKAAAVELPRGVRIGCISPTVLAESVGYHA